MIAYVRNPADSVCFQTVNISICNLKFLHSIDQGRSRDTQKLGGFGLIPISLVKSRHNQLPHQNIQTQTFIGDLIGNTVE